VAAPLALLAYGKHKGGMYGPTQSWEVQDGVQKEAILKLANQYAAGGTKYQAAQTKQQQAQTASGIDTKKKTGESAWSALPFFGKFFKGLKGATSAKGKPQTAASARKLLAQRGQ
jgi:hypothetical protein